jgi:hypothetical protein
LFTRKATNREELMSRASCLAITFLITGCAAGEPPLTAFKQISDTEFTFEARTDPIEFPEDNPETEATHMAWLKEELAKRKLCPNGFEITDRSEIAAKEATIGQTHNMAYHGVCR